jgi:hypothetical protein
MFAVSSSTALNGGAYASLSDRTQQYGAVVQKLGQVAQQVKAAPKALAAVQLQTALDQMRVLKLMGGGLGPQKEAEEAAGIAKQISGAAQNYSNGITASGTTPVASATSYAALVNPAPTPAPATTAATTGAAQATASEAAQLADDPSQFFALAFGALKTLQKIITSANQALETDSNPDDAKLARRLKKSFDDAVSSTYESANSAGLALTGNQAGTNAGGGSDVSDALSLSLTTVSVQISVDLTV